jgi:hypothetical protein
MNVRKFRRIQTIVSVALFVGVFLFCWKTTGFKLSEIQLSYWGVDKKLGWIWNACLALIAVTMYVNAKLFIDSNGRIYFKSFLKGMFFMVSFSLFLTGIVNMTYDLHDVTAYIYFFAYPLSVFFLAHLNRKTLPYKEWVTHTAFSVAMIVVPLLLLGFFSGMAIPETSHAAIVTAWGLWILLD